MFDLLKFWVVNVHTKHEISNSENANLSRLIDSNYLHEVIVEVKERGAVGARGEATPLPPHQCLQIISC